MPHGDGGLLHNHGRLPGGRGGWDVPNLGEGEEDSFNVLSSARTEKIEEKEGAYRKYLPPEETPHLGGAGHDLCLVDCVKLGLEREHARGDKVAQVGGQDAEEPRRRGPLGRGHNVRVAQVAVCQRCTRAASDPKVGQAHLRSSIAVLSGLPANSGNTCTVSSDHGLLGDECAIVMDTDGFSTRSGCPPSAPVGSAVPSGNTSTPPALGGGGAGRGMDTDMRLGVDRIVGASWWFGDVDAWLNVDRFEPVLLIPLGDRGGRGGS